MKENIDVKKFIIGVYCKPEHFLFREREKENWRYVV